MSQASQGLWVYSPLPFGLDFVQPYEIVELFWD